MKYEHDSDSEDIVMEDGSGQTEPAHMKQGWAPPQELTSSLPNTAALLGCHTGAEMIQESLSQDATETQEDKEMEPAPTTDSPSSPCSSTSSHDEPRTPTSPLGGLGNDVNKTNDDQAPSLSTSSTSRPNKDPASGSPHARSTPRPQPPPSTSTLCSSTVLPMSSIIHSKESVYAAVPTSSEVYIIPKFSRGFDWNGDLFLKPHQRRSLGVDHMFTMVGQQQHGSGNSSGMGSHMNGPQQNHQHQSQDSSIFVHEIRLDDQETAGILPSWP
ncbi:hypothetical protein B0O80DRAFT_492372 [Mortierella sp. GBAus27b]|nr:hypothetical protein B0O80DRAFT_492372 [Mortierella sp. GBAus27b]